MAIRARGANAKLALAFETTYGVPPASGYFFVPFVSANLGEEQNLIDSELLGQGREPQDPSQDVINNTGDIVVPVCARNMGLWLKGLMGAPTSTQGKAATGNYLFSANPANNSILTINGTTWTFVSALTTGNQLLIGATLTDTINNAVLALNASADANTSAATYFADTDNKKINIVHDTIGTAGNSFTIVAGTSPATNATASGATLSGGAATGNYNHVFTSGAANLLSLSLETQLTDAGSYGMNYGASIGKMAIALQRSGLLNATMSVVAQGETRAGSSAAGSPSTLALSRLAQFSGQILRDGTSLGDVVSGNVTFDNGLDPVEVIRNDGRIGGVDAGPIVSSGEFVLRFKDTVALGLATNFTPITLQYGWSNPAGHSLTIVEHRVFLPKPKLPISGPGGVQGTFQWKGAKHPTIGRTTTITLVNDQSSY